MPIFVFVSLFITLLSLNANSTSASNCAPGDIFNSATGQSCVVNTSAECAPGDVFSSVTGLPCSSGTTINLPVGCTSTSGFSSITGESCGGPVTPPTPISTVQLTYTQSSPTQIGNPILYNFSLSSVNTFDKVVVSSDCKNNEVKIYSISFGLLSCKSFTVRLMPTTGISHSLYLSSKDSNVHYVNIKASIYYKGTFIGTASTSVPVYPLTKNISTQPSVTSLGTDNALPGEKVAVYISNFPINKLYKYNVSLTGPTSSTSVIGSLSADGSYIGFTVPNINPGLYKISVFTSSGVNSYNSLPFTIGTPSTINHSPVIQSSTNRSSANVGESVNFNFSATDADNDNLSWGVDWGDGPSASSVCPVNPPIGTGQGWNYSTSHVWNTAGNYTVTVSVIDCRNGIASSSFTMNVGNVTTTQPSITVLSPNGGESWQKGTTQTIKWQDNGTSNCKVGTVCASPTYDIKLITYYQSCTGKICPMSVQSSIVYPYREPYTIAKSVSNSSYDWYVGKIVNNNGTGGTAPDGSYTIQVCQTGSTTCDSSDSYFKIVSSTVNNSSPKIVGFPAIPTNIQPGQTVNISLSATDANNDDLSWSVDWGDGPSATSSCPVNPSIGTGQGWNYSTSHVWNTAGNYTVTVYVTDCKGGSDSNSFTVNVGNTKNSPSIIVLSPNGGEVWPVGFSQTIKWSTQGLPTGSKIMIQLRGWSYPLSTIDLATVSASDKLYSWTVPSSLSAGDYRIEIYHIGSSGTPSDGLAKGISQDSFTITSSTTTTQPPVVINLPAGCTSTSGFSQTTGESCDGSATQPSPSTYPNLAGTWYFGSKVASIVQSGSTLTFTNENGSVSPGYFSSTNSVVANYWGNLTGAISSDIQTISWANNTTWTRTPPTTATNLSASVISAFPSLTAGCTSTKGYSATTGNSCAQ